MKLTVYVQIVYKNSFTLTTKEHSACWYDQEHTLIYVLTEEQHDFSSINVRSLDMEQFSIRCTGRKHVCTGRKNAFYCKAVVTVIEKTFKSLDEKQRFGPL